MLRTMRIGATAALLATLLAANPGKEGRAWADDDGQADLEKATAAKLDAKTPGDLAEVIRLLDSALQKGLDEENTQFANNLLGATHIQRGTILAAQVFGGSPRDPKLAERREAALDNLEQGLKLSPEHPEAVYFVARLNLLPGGDKQRAAEALDKAIELAAKEPQLRAKALILRAGIGKDPTKQLADLDEAIRIEPRSVIALYTRGQLLALRGKLQPALDDLNKTIELAPNYAPFHQRKAAVLARLKKYDEALVCLDRVRELMPKSVEPLTQAAQIHLAQENPQAALHMLNLARALKPDNLDVLLMRAGAHEQIKDTEKALADVDEVLKQKPDSESAVWMRAVLLAGSDRFDQAVAELQERHKKDPENLQSLMLLARLHVNEKQYGRAVEFYSLLLAKNPNHGLALRGRGDAMLNSGKHESAIADYEAAIKIHPTNTGILNNLAWVLATSPDEKLRDGKRAVDLATQACEQTLFMQAHILSTLAAAYAETGDFAGAVKWTEKGLQIGSEEQKEPLTKELESYRAGKPWRERLAEGERKPAENGPKKDDSEEAPQQQ